MSFTPYSKLPDSSFWRKSLSSIDASDVDPLTQFDIKIDEHTAVATAGSCFAQHIARYLKLNNFNYYIVEKGHVILPEKLKADYNYGTFSARYGNIYTSRQLLQLFKRAYGIFTPEEDVWEQGEGVVLDPFRPNIQPNGFSSLEEFKKDREQHYEAIRSLFETLDVFVFTLGLTECWLHNDGAVFPLCPGVAGGAFDDSKHSFKNLSVLDVTEDMEEFIELLKKVNPQAKVILTVSPVPLIATATPTHVLSSTTYSKSVLRVAAEEVSNNHPHVCYFPSYEIITGSFSRGAYFGGDLRSVTEEGVQHVMRIFFKHIASKELLFNQNRSNQNSQSDSGTTFLKKMKSIVDVICEEDLIDKK